MKVLEARQPGAAYRRTLIMALDRGGLQWFAASPCRSAAEDETFLIAPPRMFVPAQGAGNSGGSAVSTDQAEATQLVNADTSLATLARKHAAATSSVRTTLEEQNGHSGTNLTRAGADLRRKRFPRTTPGNADHRTHARGPACEGDQHAVGDDRAAAAARTGSTARSPPATDARRRCRPESDQRLRTDDATEATGVAPSI